MTKETNTKEDFAYAKINKCYTGLCPYPSWQLLSYDSYQGNHFAGNTGQPQAYGYLRKLEPATTATVSGCLAYILFCGEPERIVELFTKYPMFRSMYEQIYNMCLNIENVMGLFSKELKQLDDNTVAYMIDELQQLRAQLGEK